jgi:hypothetical protein
MDVITFFDMLGIDPGTGPQPDPAAVAQAAALWPNHIVSQTQGFSTNDDSANNQAIVLFLQGVPNGRTVQFSNLRTGVDGSAIIGSTPGQITVAADVQVIGDVVSDQTNTFYFRELPDIGVSLYPTKPGAPARCFFAKDSRGWELILEALPVIITLKAGLVEPLDLSAAGDMSGQNDDPADFNPDEPDCMISVRNAEPLPTQICTSVRIHIRPGGDVIFETNVPLSQPLSHLIGLPVRTLYDLLLIPAPENREFYEWARNDISNFLAPVPVRGGIGFRSVNFELSQPPFSDFVTSLQTGSVHTDSIELVCEDVVIPLSLGLPLPSHGTLGFRRKIVDRTSLANAFSFADSPVVIRLYPRPDANAGSAAELQFGQRGLYLCIDQLLLQSGEPPVVEFQASFVWQSGGTDFLHPGTPIGGSIAIVDDWTVQLGVVLGDESPVKFTVADTTVSLHGAKLGIGIGRMVKGLPYDDDWQILADLSVQGKPTGGKTSFFKLRSLTGKPLSIILRDIGRSFGHWTLEGLTFPEGVQLILFDTFRLIIEDMGWVEEPSGTQYFSFSGGIGLGFGGGDAIQPSGSPSYGTPSDAEQTRNKTSDGFAIEVRRLRFNTVDDSPEPFWKVDGVSLYLKYHSVLIAGFGFLSEQDVNGWHVREFGFGVQVQVNVLGADWNLAAQFFKGHRELIAPPKTAFDYFLAALTLGYLPAGSVGVYAGRLLLAVNMTPALDPNATDGQGMALYKWHKDHDTAIDMPRDRNLNDWKPVDNTLAMGMGAGLSFNGCGNAFHVNIFVLYSKGDTERGLLAVGELFLLKNPKPLAFLAIEYDLDTNKFGVLAGINLKLTDFVAVKADIPSWMNDLVSITGNVYFGNQPWTFAFGQLSDPRTWPSITVKFDVGSFVLGVCFEVVDGGPKGGGILFTLTFNLNWYIGKTSLYGSVGIIIGNWKTGSDAVGFAAFAELGLKIYLFAILHFGLHVTAKYSYLGEHPWHKSYSLQFTIDTPWWMPNVSFSIDRSWNEQLPYDQDLLNRPLSAASVVGSGPAGETALLAPPLSDGNSDAAKLYTFDDFVGISGVSLGDVHLRTDIPIVATDAVIAVNFTNPISNDMGVAAETYTASGDAGVQNVKDITLRYGLKSIAVRRSPRYGTGAGVWTDLVAPSDTALDTTTNVHLAPALSFRWDADSRADGAMSPKRLLMNSSTPFTFSTGSSQNDEEALRNDFGYPCCNASITYKQYYPKPHVLLFGSYPLGTRVPVRQQFSTGGVWWQWTISPPPLARNGITTTTASTVVALMHPSLAGVIGSADMPDPAITASCSLSWTQAASVTIYFEAYSGVNLVTRQQASLDAAGSTTLHLNAPQGQVMNRILLRMGVSSLGGSAPSFSLQVEEIDYVTSSETIAFLGRVSRCGSMSSSGGKLALLPNHDYEVTITTEAKVSTQSQGERSTNLSEVFYFRTKGLPGLNSVTNTGDEIEPYIESLYPAARAMLLYREEPVAISFREGMSSLLPVDRVNAPTDPPEKTQIMELALNIDRVSSTKGLARLTVPSGDWIDAHRLMPPPRLFPRVLVAGVDAKYAVRKAPSFDPLVMRYVALQSVSSTCTVDPIHSSQVLVHEPLGPGNAAGPWEPQATLRATVRQKDGPYTRRTAFDLLDSGAFISQADGGAVPAGAWTVVANQALVAPASGSGRQYASFGDLGWNHLTVQAQFDPRGAAAGLAVGVAGGNSVPQAILATVEPDGAGHSLVLRSLLAGLQTELARAAVILTQPVSLTVYAFDDAVRAVVGDTSVEAPRWSIREGRVALVADGPAAFSMVAVDALDLYHFDFRTSRYTSFSSHIQSWDGRLVELSEGSAGAGSTPLATLFASDATTIAGVMTEAADPQARQALFTKWVTGLALPLRQQPEALCLSRWTGPNGTLALLVESPEPLAFSRDVSVTLIERIKPRWAPIGPPATQAALLHLQFQGTAVNVPLQFAIFRAGDAIVRISQTAAGPTLAVYSPPLRTFAIVTPGHLQKIIPEGTVVPPALNALRKFPDGTIALLRSQVLLAAVNPGIPTGPLDKPIPLVVFSNGPETAALLLPSSGAGSLSMLGPGTFTLKFAIHRERWRDTSFSNPESQYLGEQAVNLNW